MQQFLFYISDLTQWMCSRGEDLHSNDATGRPFSRCIVARIHHFPLRESAAAPQSLILQGYPARSFGRDFRTLLSSPTAGRARLALGNGIHLHPKNRITRTCPSAVPAKLCPLRHLLPCVTYSSGLHCRVHAGKPFRGTSITRVDEVH
jgi:hypothetical protein